ncbi:hypothetical protein A2810_02090 [candidate division Kazan bacterium RIFCSPHIGHO2_01_FULL_49_10]|nr:MAG: hypothetical protein A2810_02090 [candidate division Kazan bacterium RIFCSPHIGHO2_01_FULL_49_10]
MFEAILFFILVLLLAITSMGVANLTIILGPKKQRAFINFYATFSILMLLPTLALSLGPNGDSDLCRWMWITSTIVVVYSGLEIAKEMVNPTIKKSP